MKKVGKFIGCFFPIIVALLCQVAISIGFSLVYGIYLGIKMAAMRQSRSYILQKA